jgi:peptidoglycan/LPS O-acetylase OafA/YrhL
VTDLSLQPARGRRFIPEVDGLRAVAILAVLVTHLWGYPAGWPLVNQLAATGWAGVDLFFVLSGYLITGILWDARQAPHYFRNFYVRRVLRIFPVYYLLLLIVFILLPLAHPSASLDSVRSQWRFYVFYFANVSLAIHGWNLFLLDITWSLSVEEQFYVLWPAIVRHLDARRMLWLCTILIVGTPLLRTLLMSGARMNWRWSYMMTFLRADSFAWGAALAVGLREGLVDARKLRPVAIGTLAILAPMLLFLIANGRFHRDSMLVGTIGYSLIALVSTSLLVTALAPGKCARLMFSSRPMRHIGKVSYGMYIYHPLCLMVAGTAMARTGLSATGTTSAVGAAGKLVGMTVVTWVVATMSFRYFEQPLLRLKHRFETVGIEPAPSWNGDQGTPTGAPAAVLVKRG